MSSDKKWTMLLTLLAALWVFGPADGQTASGRFVLISDIHFNPFHDPSLFPQLVEQPVEQWEKLFASSHKALWSRYGEDSNYALLKSTLDDARSRLAAPDFILYPGDYLAHQWQAKYDALAKKSHDSDPVAYRRFTTKTMQFLAREFRIRWPNSPIIGTLGNNDSFCGNYSITPQGPFLAMFADVWRGLLGGGMHFAEPAKDFSDHSLYTVRIAHMKRHRIVVLNDAYWSNRYDNACGRITQTPALDQLAALENILADCRSAGEKVWLLLHIPAGIDNYASSAKAQGQHGRPVTFWQQTLTSRFAQLAERYAPTVQIIFAGHTHMDDFRIIRLNGEESLLMKIAPSISPIFGTNPCYQTYQYDGSTGRIENYQSVFLPLNDTHGRTGADGRARWELEYDFGKIYRWPELNAATVEKLAEQIRTGAITRHRYGEFYDSGGPTRFDAATINAYRCAILNTTPAHYRKCVEAPNPAP